MTRFELATSASRTQRSTKLSHTPMKYLIDLVGFGLMQRSPVCGTRNCKLAYACAISTAAPSRRSLHPPPEALPRSSDICTRTVRNMIQGQTQKIHVVVGTGVPDCPFNETIFAGRRYVCYGQSGTPVPTNELFVLTTKISVFIIFRNRSELRTSNARPYGRIVDFVC